MFFSMVCLKWNVWNVITPFIVWFYDQPYIGHAIIDLILLYNCVIYSTIAYVGVEWYKNKEFKKAYSHVNYWSTDGKNIMLPLFINYVYVPCVKNLTNIFFFSLGRKFTMTICMLSCLALNLVSALAPHVIVYALARFLLGVFGTAASTASYILSKSYN